MDRKIKEEILRFRDERNWSQYHNPKDLAISLSLESAELLEAFQWKTSEEAVKEKSPEIADELADVFIYGVLLAEAMDLDIPAIISDKLTKNKAKYPVDKAFGKRNKYTEL